MCSYSSLQQTSCRSSSSLGSGSSSPTTSFLSSPAILGEAVLIDKETGRVLWEGGSLSSSVAAATATVQPKLHQLGFIHVRCTILTTILVLGILGYIAQWIQKKLPSLHTTDSSGRKIPITRLMIVFMFMLRWSLFLTPKFNRWFLICTYLLYLLESYTCSTRKFLANAISGPDGIEEFIENLRREKPEVEWMVQCFHYEKPLGAFTPTNLCRRLVRYCQKVASWGGSNPLLDDALALRNTVESSSSSSSSKIDDAWPTSTLTGMGRRKVITKRATGMYEYVDCADKTFAGVWKRAPSALPPSSSLPEIQSHQQYQPQEPPFAKIILSKLILLKDRKAREEYLKQQSRFVMRHCQGDQCIEFSTSIRVEGFRPNLLAERPVTGVASTKLFRLHMFWIFTILGLSVPYRRWFVHHCDEIRVTVVKELSADLPEHLQQNVTTSTAASGRGWFTTKTKVPSRKISSASERKAILDEERKREETFQSLMQSLKLYATKMSASSDEHQNATAALKEDVEVATSFLVDKAGDSSPLVSIILKNATNIADENTTATSSSSLTSETSESPTTFK